MRVRAINLFVSPQHWHNLMENSKCPICMSRPQYVRSRVVLRHHRAHYLRCPSCAYIWIHQPGWLDEAYSDPIAAMDTGVVDRNFLMAQILTVLLDRLFAADGKFLDAGAGHGLLVRLMRDRGFDFRWLDPHSHNLFARGFEDDGGSYAAVTAIEVMEHLKNPKDFISELLHRTQAETFIFTTEIYDRLTPVGEIPSDDWWYFAYESGQHIGFFSHLTLMHIASQFDMRLLTNGTLHMLTAMERPTQRMFRLMLHPRVRQLLAFRARQRRESLTWADHEKLRARMSLGEQSI